MGFVIEMKNEAIMSFNIKNVEEILLTKLNNAIITAIVIKAPAEVLKIFIGNIVLGSIFILLFVILCFKLKLETAFLASIK